MEDHRRRNVIHFKAGFISPTETFVYNQIRYAEQYIAYVFSRYRKDAPFDLSNISLHNTSSILPWKLDRLLAGALLSSGSTSSVMVNNFFDGAKKINPSIIHAHFGPDGTYILPLALKLNVPLVTSFYGYDVSEFPNRAGGFAKHSYRILREKGDCFLVMTKAMRADLISLGFPEDKIIIHHYGIHVDEFARHSRDSQSSTQKISLLQVGSLGGKKGQMYVLQALNKILQEEKGLDVQITFVGRGEGEAELRRYVDEHNMKEKVSFLGFVAHGEELRKIFERSDIFIHPSVTPSNGDKEGLPTTILEAMSAELPVIATYHAGIPEAVIDGNNGILVNEYDVDALAKAILVLAKDTGKRREFGKNARATVLQKYDFKNQIRELEEIYTQVISEYENKRS